MTNLKNTVLFAAAFVFAYACFAQGTFGQERDRITKTVSSQPVNAPATVPPQTKTTVSSQPTNAPTRQPLTNDIKVYTAPKPLVQKTGESSPLNAMASAAGRASRYSAVTTGSMLQAIRSRLGIPYRYGATGPNRYDCSGFVWQVFNDAGIIYERQSARSLWADSIPVEGDEKYRFGTLVFFNGLGHVGIVADENGFYHASSSKGITYSPFKGYWEKRIVGFRRFAPPVSIIDPQKAAK